MSQYEQMQAILERQLSMTRTTWSRLGAHGFHDGQSLVLDFFFGSPSYEQAKDLRDFLLSETDYDVHVTADQDVWTVHGSTQSTPVSLAILEQWVDWMVSVGFRYDCVFDGWGAEVG